MSEEEPVCPMEIIEGKCRNSMKCAKLLAKFEECEARVRSRPGTTENCSQELFDLTPCINECVAKNLPQFLK